jgi:ketosteroid isomerase-like protein
MNDWKFYKGPEEIRQLWQELLNQGIKNIKLEVLEVEQLGNMAIEVEKAVLFGENGQVMDKGKYIVVWKRQEF